MPAFRENQSYIQIGLLGKILIWILLTDLKLSNLRIMQYYIFVLSSERDSVLKRTGGNRMWIISAIHIRAEMEFRAHSQSYLKITAGDPSSF